MGSLTLASESKLFMLMGCTGLKVYSKAHAFESYTNVGNLDDEPSG